VGDFVFTVHGTEIEGGGPDPGVDVQYPWEDSPRRFSRRTSMEIKPFFIDKFPVTNAQFKQFLGRIGTMRRRMRTLFCATGKAEHTLRVWKSGRYRVSLEDARAYASWRASACPYEWMALAAQGPMSGYIRGL